MVKSKRLEPLLHIAGVDKAVVSDTPVGQNGRESGEWIQRHLIRVSTGVCCQESRDSDIRRSLAHLPYLRAKGMSGIGCTLKEASVGIVQPGILHLHTVAHHGQILQHIVESLRIVSVYRLRRFE